MAWSYRTWSRNGASSSNPLTNFAATIGSDWVHLALTRDSSENGELWIIGVSAGTTSGTIETSIADDLMIGAIRATGVPEGAAMLFFEGLIDEVRI